MNNRFAVFFVLLLFIMASEAEELSEVNNSSNLTGREAASREGLIIAYSGLMIMALVPILVGSLRSVTYHYNLRKKGERPEDRIRLWDAAVFPFYASGVLFGLYLVFKYLPKDIVNMILSAIFCSLGATALARVTSVMVAAIVGPMTWASKYTLQLTKSLATKTSEMIKLEFTVVDLMIFISCAGVVIYHLFTKHWVLNNMIGLAFCVNAIEMISMESVGVGCLLLGGLFLYDVFWVFGTDVMVTVAKSFDAPIKLMIPLDLPENGLSASNFGMLGLGDIVVPGLFIALLCRFDSFHRPQHKKLYFIVSFIAYIVGLVSTVVVMYVFKAAQPALLYLVPCCVGLPLLLALVRGEIMPLFNYKDYPEKEKVEGDSDPAAADSNNH